MTLQYKTLCCTVRFSSVIMHCHCSLVYRTVAVHCTLCCTVMLSSVIMHCHCSLVYRTLTVHRILTVHWTLTVCWTLTVHWTLTVCWILTVCWMLRVTCTLTIFTHRFTNRDDVKPYNIYGVTIGEVEVDLLTGQHQVSCLWNLMLCVEVCFIVMCSGGLYCCCTDWALLYYCIK